MSYDHNMICYLTEENDSNGIREDVWYMIRYNVDMMYAATGLSSLYYTVGQKCTLLFKLLQK